MISFIRFVTVFAVMLLQVMRAGDASAQQCMGSDTSPQGCQDVVPSNTTAPPPTVSEGVRLNHSVGNVLFDYYGCLFVASNSSTYDYFVPQATQNEFMSFLQNPPVGVTFANCILPINYTATPTVSNASYSIYAEGGAITPSGAGTVAPITNIMVPTNQTVNSGIMEAPATTTVSVVNQSSMQPIQFFYTRRDCVNDPFLNPPACNTWIIRETQTIIFTAPATAPLGTNSSWLSASSPPVVTSTYDISTDMTGPWTPVTVDGVPLASGGTPGIYNNDYQPPAIQSCTVSGVTYEDGQTWTTTVNSTQSPTSTECPLGAGTRVDTMQSTVTNICNNGTSAVQSSSPPVETGFTGLCATSPAVNAGENIYITDSGNSRIEIFNMQGAYSSQFGTFGTGNGQLGNWPWSVRLDQSGNLTVSDQTNGRIETFTTAGAYVSQFSVPGPGLALQTPGGSYWTTIEATGLINQYSSAGTSMLSVPGFIFPMALAVDSNGNTWLGDNYIIKKLDSNGNVVFSFGSLGTGNGQLSYVWGMAFQPGTGNLWVADRNNNRVEVFNPTTGAYISQFGTFGTGNGQFNLPIDLAFDAQGNVWVVDMGNNRVQEFDSSGNYLSQFGTLGTGNGQFNCPISIAITPPTSNPACGSANGQTLSSIPTTNLCMGGTASAVTDNGAGSWVWTCTQTGLPAASCSVTQSGPVSCPVTPTGSGGTFNPNNPAAYGMQLTFDDEFNAVDWAEPGQPAVWEANFWYNTPLPCNFDEEPFSLSSGILDMSIGATSPAMAACGVPTPYAPYPISHLDTYRTFSQTYGYWEARAQASSVYGTIFAFWLTPMAGISPPELDMPEILGRMPTIDHVANHYIDATGANAEQYLDPTVVDLSQAFHIYGMYWDASTITWYLDGNVVGSEPSQPGEGIPMYMILEFSQGACGDGWADCPQNSPTYNASTYSANAQVDWVHVWGLPSSNPAVAPQSGFTGGNGACP